MAQSRRNALLLFAKLPEPGMAKTRLSVLKDGIFSPEDASGLFGCMLLDVIEISLSAFNQVDGDCQLIISTAPAKNTEAMRAFVAAEFEECEKSNDAEMHAEDSVDDCDGTDQTSNRHSNPPIRVISDSGRSFDEHYNDAFRQVWDMGFDSILSMGADMPALTVDDLVRGFEALHRLAEEGRKGIVLAPDQEMGVSIVGWNRDLDFDHSGVYYNPSGLTVLPAYIDKARAASIDVIWLPPVPDVDTIADLSHNLTLMDALSYCSEYKARESGDNRPGSRNSDIGIQGNAKPAGDKLDVFPWAHRTYAMLEELGCTMIRIPPNELRDPRDVIDE